MCVSATLYISNTNTTECAVMPQAIQQVQRDPETRAQTGMDVRARVREVGTMSAASLSHCKFNNENIVKRGKNYFNYFTWPLIGIYFETK